MYEWKCDNSMISLWLVDCITYEDNEQAIYTEFTVSDGSWRRTLYLDSLIDIKILQHLFNKVAWSIIKRLFKYYFIMDRIAQQFW